MKIFISYGHNDHTPLVNALFDALLRDGHEPWKDDRYEAYQEKGFASGIRPGEDFTKVIYNAIDNSDFVLAFVTAKTEDSLYCRDERQYAYNSKREHFIQLRLDGAQIRLGNSLSYVDMDAAEDSAGKVNTEALEEKMKVIYTAFRNPGVLLNAGEKFERYLKTTGAVQYEEFVTMPGKENFVGRQWLAETCKKWVLDATIPCRLFVLLGEAGTGKTAFVRHLAADKALVRSVHICVYDRPITRNVRDTLKDLAYTLTQTNPAYYHYLKNKDFSPLEGLECDGLFEFLFIEPLKNEQEKYLLIIDGLDEMEEKTGLLPLMKLLRQYAHKLNPNISVLVTGRPETNIISALKTVNPDHDRQSVVLSRDNGREDLQDYIEKNLQALGYDSPALAEQILTACDGNFEYLTLLFTEAKQEGLQLSGTMTLPKGLSGRYTQYLNRRMESSKQEDSLSRKQKMLLAVLCVAYEPMPLSLLSKITGYDEEDVEDELNVFGSLLRKTKTPDGDVLVSFFSKGFRDYLLSGEFENYTVKVKPGNRQIAEYMLGKCKTEGALQKRPYLDRYGFAHLLLYLGAEDEQEAVFAYIDTLAAENTDRTARRIADGLCAGGEAAVQAYYAQWHSLDTGVQTVLMYRRASEGLLQIADAYEQRGDRLGALALRADVALMNPNPAAYARAEELYRQVLKETEENYREDPVAGHKLVFLHLRLGEIAAAGKTTAGREKAETCYREALRLAKENYAACPDCQTRVDLTQSYGRLGSVVADAAEAESCYREAFRLAEENYRKNPGYNTRQNLLSACDNLGDMLCSKRAEGFAEEAEKLYRQAFRLAEENYQESPGYFSRQSLSFCHGNMGNLAKMKDEIGLAESCYREALKLAEENYGEIPDNASRRELLTCYENLSSIARKKDTREGLLEAEDWYWIIVGMGEQTYRENPCYDSRHGLAVHYMKLGEMKYNRLVLSEGTWEDLVTAEDLYRKACELFDENYRQDPSVQNRRDLACCYSSMGDLALVKDTPESLQEAEDAYREAVDLMAQNCAQKPNPEDWYHSADFSHILGSVFENRGGLEHCREAEKYYQQAYQWLQMMYQNQPTQQIYGFLMAVETSLYRIKAKLNQLS